MFTIYTLHFPDNTYYIGQTRYIFTRLRQHKNRGPNRKHKYSHYVPIAHCTTREEARHHERLYILCHISDPLCLNKSVG